MKKISITVLLLILGQSLVSAYSYPTTGQDNVNTFNYYNSDQNNFNRMQQNIKENAINGYDEYPKITQVEGLLFRRTFINEDISERLNRIEKKMFRKSNPQLDLYTRTEIISQNIDPGLMYNIPTKNLSTIENKLLGKSFDNDDIESRVIRLEKEMLGAMQKGDLKERYEVVAEAAKHYNAFPYLTSNNAGPHTNQNTYQQNAYQQYAQPQYPQGYYDQQNYNQMQQPRRGIRGFLGNLASSIAGNGVMTGYTPPMMPGQYGYDPMYDQYTNMGSNYLPSGSGIDRSLQTRYGNYNTYDNYGTGSSVRVLYD